MTSPNTLPLTYNGIFSLLGTMAVFDVQTVGGVVEGVDAYSNVVVPQAIAMAETRISRDLDLQSTLTSRTYAMSAGNATLVLSTNDFVAVQDVIATINSVAMPLLPVTKEYIQYVFPSTSTPAPPAVFAMSGGDLATGGATSNLITLGPVPNNAYAVTVYGTIRAPSLTSFNTDPAASTSTTFISTYLQDMLLQASMVYIAEYQRNFGKVADDPAMAMTYEGAYQTLLKSALREEYQKKFAASAWSSMSTSPVATPA